MVAGREDGEFAGKVGGDFGKKRADETAAFGGEFDFDETAVTGFAGAGDEAVALEIFYDEGEVAAAFEELAGEFGWEEWAEVVEGFEGSELREREMRGQSNVSAGRDGIGGTHEFEVGAEGESFGLRTLVTRAHSLAR